MEEDKYKKKSIPKSLRIAVWNEHIGENIGKIKCLCCNITEITQLKFHCGHILAEKNGGETTVKNMIPICETCNKSMGTTNLYEFKKIINDNDSIANVLKFFKDLENNDVKECKKVANIIFDKYIKKNNNKCQICDEEFRDNRCFRRLSNNYQQISEHLHCFLNENNFILIINELYNK